ncbi:hypothetical protein CEXT_493741 [Caerostris extrusa]|uniref:Uncharacterized protein n=1 Tax=Caerostris extrusa TaxID=172846 RepID=A0AAV4T7L7_CAEEX|nr:hypothetical protein CEXT_493741 [Caerostris extrusa]
MPRAVAGVTVTKPSKRREGEELPEVELNSGPLAWRWGSVLSRPTFASGVSRYARLFNDLTYPVRLGFVDLMYTMNGPQMGENSLKPFLLGRQWLLDLYLLDFPVVSFNAKVKFQLHLFGNLDSYLSRYESRLLDLGVLFTAAIVLGDLSVTRTLFGLRNPPPIILFGNSVGLPTFPYDLGLDAPSQL